MLFMAPERISGKVQTYELEICKRADMWSLGIIMFFLISGEFPFDACTCNELYNVIKKGQLNFNSSIWNKVPDSA